MERASLLRKSESASASLSSRCRKTRATPHVSPVPYTVLVNPQLTPLGNEMDEGWEGCLSVPGMRGLVPRYQRLRYQGFDQNGAPIDRTVEGFHARVVQHEVDHLDGILYPQRVRDLRNFGFEDVLMGQMTPDAGLARSGRRLL